MGMAGKREKEAGMVRYCPVEEAQWAASTTGSDEHQHSYSTPAQSKHPGPGYLFIQIDPRRFCKVCIRGLAHN